MLKNTLPITYVYGRIFANPTQMKQPPSGSNSMSGKKDRQNVKMIKCLHVYNYIYFLNIMLFFILTTHQSIVKYLCCSRTHLSQRRPFYRQLPQLNKVKCFDHTYICWLLVKKEYLYRNIHMFISIVYIVYIYKYIRIYRIHMSIFAYKDAYILRFRDHRFYYLKVPWTLQLCYLDILLYTYN